MNWLMVNTSVSSYNLSVASSIHHIVGLSLTVNNVLHGIHWAECTHSLSSGMFS